MKKTFLLAMLLFSLSTGIINTQTSETTSSSDTQSAKITELPLFSEEHLLTVVLMVKDEEGSIEATLQPLIEGGIDSFFIFDTGSTDRTMEIAQEFFDRHGVTHTCIMQEPFIDFAASRNRALDLAQAVFPNTLFMLMPDAEWHLHNVEGLLQFCEQERYTHTSSYLVRILHPYSDFYTSRLLRCKFRSRFVGVVHEVLIPSVHQKVSPDVYFELRTTHYGREKSRRRWLRDLDILLKHYEKNKNNHDTRTMFYIAQTYACLDDYENAYAWYTKRAQLHGWDEEDFITTYRLAGTAEILTDTHEDYSWELAQQHYLDAHGARYSRIEPLIKLADHYWSVGNYPVCYMFAKRASELPYPENDVLFVEKEMYDYCRYEILSKCAWHVNEYAIGEWGTRMALIAHPDYIHLHRNLEFYLNYKAKNDVCFAIN